MERSVQYGEAMPLSSVRSQPLCSDYAPRTALTCLADGSRVERDKSAAPWPGGNEQDSLRNVEQTGYHVVLEQPGSAGMTAT
jgi:hypothetical protein